ncbi:MAG: hypothetical protein Q7S55_01380 [Nanoarchaeota archaeon]|nr:hypothetical protein [Nanoarchaeota archaeon]
MDKFEKNYGVKEDKSVKIFHRSRRMFCIKSNRLYLAKPKVDYSHAVWFEKEGWDDNLIEKAVRGIVDKEGNIHFYYGYDFDVNRKSEKIFFTHLPELVKKLRLGPTAKILGGKIKKKNSKEWPPKKRYGRVVDHLGK